MALIQFRYTVSMKSGKTYEVTAGQRDIIEFEAQPFGTSLTNAMRDKLFTLMWFTAWSALVREGVLGLTWDQFKDEVSEVVDQVPAEPVVGVDPTNPAPLDGP